MKIQPTQEQLDIISAFRTNRVLKVNAVAGSGKTSTLTLLAQDNNKSSIYICFNRAIAEEARTKFPEHVTCRTSHSLAYAEFGIMLKHKLERPKGTYRNVAGTSSEIAKYFAIADIESNDETVKPIKNTAIAAFAKFTVNNFQNSADDTLSAKHLPNADIKDTLSKHQGIQKDYLVNQILKYAKLLWNARSNPASDVLCTPDTYLKLYQLSKPVLSYDIIYLDEAQDSNPAVLDIVRRQTHCKIAYVGDTYQSIYQFRGAVNAMNIIDAPTMLLSKSFRYGSKIAEIAKYVINDAIDVKGNENISSSIQALPSSSYTYIFRTNSHLLETAVALIEQGENIHIDINTRNFVKLLESTQALYKNDYKNVKHEDITPYSTWLDLLEASKEEPELRRLVDIVKNKDVGDFIRNLTMTTDKQSANILLTTAHKSKGCEWSNVVLAGDFPLSSSADPLDGMSQQEINLLYVAVTRAIDSIVLPVQLAEVFEDQEGE